VVDEIDICRAPQALIKQHGEDAPAHAAGRAQELLAEGDAEGCVTWKRVVSAVKELLDKREGEPVH
jgi:hypothetical protein